MKRTTAVVALLFSVGCSDKKAGSTSCPPGEVSIDRMCRALCLYDRDCTGGAEICDSGVCLPGAREGIPEITSIDGDGPADGAQDHTEHHVQQRVVINGAHFEGALVTLTSNGSARELTPCQFSANQLVVELPNDIAAGNHTLSVANQAGACDGTLQLLQGVQGPALEVVTTAGLSGNGTSGSPLTLEWSQISQNAVGANLVPNGNFDDGLAGWSFGSDGTAAAGAIVANAGGPFGDNALQNNNTGTSQFRFSSTARIAVRQDEVYRATGTFRVSPGTVNNFGRMYLHVRAWDTGGSEISSGNGDPWWRQVISFHLLNDSQWTSFAVDVGPGTSFPFPSNVAQITVGGILNYYDADSDPVANREIMVQGLGLYRVTPPATTSWMPLQVVAGSEYVPFNTTENGMHAAWHTPQLRRIGSQVCLRGIVRRWDGNDGVAVTDNTLIALLPRSFCPPGALMFNTGQGWNPSTETGADQITINAAGQLTVRHSNGDSMASFDGICFFVD